MNSQLYSKHFSTAWGVIATLIIIVITKQGRTRRGAQKEPCPLYIHSCCNTHSNYMVKVAVNPKTTNIYNGIARAIFFLYSILNIIPELTSHWGVMGWERHDPHLQNSRCRTGSMVMVVDWLALFIQAMCGRMLFTLAASVVQIQPPRQYPIYKNIFKKFIFYPNLISIGPPPPPPPPPPPAGTSVSRVPGKNLIALPQTGSKIFCK